MNVQSTGVLFASLVAVLSPTTQAQTFWMPATTSAEPSPRLHAGMAYDVLRQRMVLFGGEGNGFGYDSDTWEFDGTSWSQRSPAVRPSSRASFAITYDRGRGVVVIQGGSSGNGETWEYDGTTWRQRTTAHTPGDRSSHAMVYDVSRGVLVLFGGSYGGFSDETWEYNGFDWILATPPASPPARNTHVMAFDTLRNRVVMHGGFNASGVLRDTWEYDGRTWVRTVAQGPQRDETTMCFDTYRARTVLFGGNDPWNGLLQDTLEYDGTAWVTRTTVGPASRTAAALAYDSVRRECVMFGGRGQYQQPIGGTYRYVTLNPASLAAFGSGCPGTWATPRLRGYDYDLPYIAGGMRLAVDFTPGNAAILVFIGSSRTSYAGVPLPFDLGPVGMNGCALLASMALVLPGAAVGHYAQLPLTLPNQPALVGGSFFAQALVVDPGANAAGAVMTQGLEGRFGAR